jgi:hypothetical protein
MIFRVTRSVFARYGRPAIILFAITGYARQRIEIIGTGSVDIYQAAFFVRCCRPSSPGCGFRVGAGLGCCERDSSQNKEQPSPDFHRSDSISEV